MSVVSEPQNVPQQTESNDASRQVHKERLLTIIDKGLPPFPAIILELTNVLGNSNPDIKKAGKLIRSDPSLTSQVLRLCNSPAFGLRSRVISIEQGAVLLGTERLRNLAMTCSLLSFAGNALQKDQLTSYWSHSFLAALLSEHLAVNQGYFEKEQVYIAGLLHDIGRLPQYMLIIEEQSKKKPVPPIWVDNIQVEIEYFGMDHCVAGGRMAKAWNFMPSFIDVLENHQTPEEARHDPVLVEMVGSVERFLLTKAADSLAAGDNAEPKIAAAPPEDILAYEGFELLNDPAVLAMLNAEYERLLPLLRTGLPGLNKIDA